MIEPRRQNMQSNYESFPDALRALADSNRSSMTTWVSQQLKELANSYPDLPDQIADEEADYVYPTT